MSISTTLLLPRLRRSAREITTLCEDLVDAQQQLFASLEREAHRGVPVAELARLAGVRRQSFYRWATAPTEQPQRTAQLDDADRKRIARLGALVRETRRQVQRAQTERHQLIIQAEDVSTRDLSEAADVSEVWVRLIRRRNNPN